MGRQGTCVVHEDVDHRIPTLQLGRSTPDRCKIAEIGDPTARILETARSHDADLIVIGRRGLGPIGRLLLGSVSAKVLQLAGIPCLVVP